MTASVPASIELLKDFENTREFARTSDALGTLAGARGWLASRGLDPVPDDDARLWLLEFREALRGLLASNAGQADERSAWSALEPFAARTTLKVEISEAGVALRPAGSDAARAAAASLLGILYDAVSAGTWRRLKVCRDPDCRWAYYDRSKNVSSAWCSMASCGNRMKARRRRKRQKSAAQVALNRA